MTKDVLVSIKGLQFNGNAEEAALETITKADYYLKNGNHYLIYDEVTEGYDRPTKNIIKFKNHEMQLTKKGLINVNMLFEENKKNMTNYVTPFGDILIGLDTECVEMHETDSNINLAVDYALEVNYEYLADCKIIVDIKPKNDDFRLQS